MSVDQKVNFTLPEVPFVVDDLGSVIAMVSKNGKKNFFPAGYTNSNNNALTAFAGGGQASAVQLNYRISRVTTVASAGDSVKLPKALAGMSMTLINGAAANAMDVFPSSGETINALSADTALSVAANKFIQFVCPIDGKWYSNLTA